MNAESHFDRYLELQSFVGWSEQDVVRILELAPVLEPYLPALFDDFYETIERHSGTRQILTGGQVQIDRLKGTLCQWLRELFSGRYDEAYVERRWKVGWRHVEIGLDQVYTNVAMSRLRSGLIRSLRDGWRGTLESLCNLQISLNKLLDLDLAIIEDAYQTEYLSRLQRRERLASLGEVAGGVAHELRNPLNVVKTSVYFLSHAQTASPEKQHEHLKRIERNVDLADGVITALSSFARMPIPNVRPVPLNHCVREALELNPPGERIDVQIDCPESIPPALVDTDLLRIVLGNLIRNACDAMPSGGQLMIVGRFVPEMLELKILDTGHGIKPDDLARITEPLYTTKVKGLGLGLAIVKSILDKMDGRMSVVSDPGAGSAFTLHLRAESQK